MKVKVKRRKVKVRLGKENKWMAVSILNTDVPPTSSWEHYHLIIQEELEN